MAYLGYYINLDRSPDRRAAMDAQLAALGLTDRYQRFAAVDGTPPGLASPVLTASELGCFASHHQLLQGHLGGAAHLHIIEDDIMLAGRTAAFIDGVIAAGLLDRHDLLFTDMVMQSDLNFIRRARRWYASDIARDTAGTATEVRFRPIAYTASMTSYLVNRQSTRLVSDLFGRELASGAKRPVDLFIRDQVAAGRLRASCLFPFITSIRPGAPTSMAVRNDHDQLSTLALDLLRHSFFVECDLAATLALADQFLPSAGEGPHDRLLARTLGFITSDAFRQP
jgi:GR25 family glycosyltransferase involved in LPS biosynthesis